jgi:cation diffusion facilitator family transporter
MQLMMRELFVGTDRQIRGIKVSLVGFGGNLVLSLVKIVVGILSGSIAVIVDSLNNLLDSISSIMTIVGFRFAARKGDHVHPHGHGRVEYVIAFVISMIIIVTALILGSASVQRIIEPVAVDSSLLYIVIIALSILGKGGIAAIYLLKNRTIKSQMLAASGRDALADILATGATLMALILAPVTNFPVDGAVGLLMSVFILVLGGKSFFTNYHLLIGHGPGWKVLDDIRKIVLEKESFAKITSVDFHDYGPESREVLVKVHLSLRATTSRIDRDISLVQKELLAKYSAVAVLYWPPGKQ